MGIEVTRLEETEGDRWNRYVGRASNALPFHRHEALKAIASESGSDLHLLVGLKGEEPVGLLPLFYEKRGPGRTLQYLTSPPTMIQVPYLGPLLLTDSKMKQRKEEKRNKRFIENCNEWIDTNFDPDYVHIHTHDRFSDARPFIWNEYDVEPLYTYVLDLMPDEDALLEKFSSDARNNIRNANEDRYSFEKGDDETIRRIVKHMRRRISGIDERYHGITPELGVKMYNALPDGYVRPYELWVDGEYAGGGITLESDDTVFRWQGFSKSPVDFPVNDVLDWCIMRRAANNELDRYDLVGAMESRLCEYKAKFNPEPRVVYAASRKSLRMHGLLSVFNHLPDSVKHELSTDQLPKLLR